MIEPKTMQDALARLVACREVLRQELLNNTEKLTYPLVLKDAEQSNFVIDQLTSHRLRLRELDNVIAEFNGGRPL